MLKVPGGDVLKAAKGSVLPYTYMRVQIDRFEDGWAVLVLYPNGTRTFDVPRDLLPAEASAGDVFEARFEFDAAETERISEENRRLLGGLIRRQKR